MESSAEPEVLMFKHFKSQWKSLDKNNFTTIATTELAKTVYQSICHYLGRKIEKSLKERKDLHNNYRRFIELLLIFMGMIPPRNICLMAPGPMRHARSLSKLLYS